MVNTLSHLVATEVIDKKLFDDNLATMKATEKSYRADIKKYEDRITELISMIKAQGLIVEAETKIRNEAQTQWNNVNTSYQAQLVDAATDIANF